MARHDNRTITLHQFRTNDTSWFVHMGDECIHIIHDLDLDAAIGEAMFRMVRGGEE